MNMNRRQLVTIVALVLNFSSVRLLAATSPTATESIAGETGATGLSKSDQHQMDAEVKLGVDGAAEIAKTGKFVKGKDILERVNTIGRKLGEAANSAPYPALYATNKLYPFQWHFLVIDDPQVNAFSLPGGYVYIYKGLLDQVRSDDELAGILGHEITHGAHHHVVAIMHESNKMSTEFLLGMVLAAFAHMRPEDLSNVAGTAQLAQQGVINLKYSQAAERDADHGGVILMQRAGYNPLGMLTMMMHLHDIERRSPNIELGIFRDHPYSEDRVANIRSQLTDLHVATDTAAWNRVTGAARASVLSAGNKVRQIMIGGVHGTPVALCSLYDPDGSRSTAAVKRLNEFLDKGLQMYQVRASGGAVFADDQVLMTIVGADIPVNQAKDAESLADAIGASLRKQLWLQAFTRDSEM